MHLSKESLINSATVIRKLCEDQQFCKELGNAPAIAYFYFDFKAKQAQTVDNALRRIVLQLSAQSPHRYRALNRHYILSDGQILPSYQDLERVLKELFLELGRTYIILDALDECEDTAFGPQLVDLITTLRDWTKTPLHLLFASQPRTIFRDRFRDVPQIYLDSDIMQKDIELFVTSELRANHKLKMWVSDGDKIIQLIVSKSSGM